MSGYNISSVEYENQCKKWHNDLVQDFEINNTKNLEKRLDEIENIVNDISSPESLSNDQGHPVLDNDIDNIDFNLNFKIERNERDRLTKLCNANIREYTTVSVPKCTGVMTTIDDYKKKARNKLNRWKPKFYGDHVLFQIIFINIYNHCYTIGMHRGWSDGKILYLFVRIFHKLLDSKIRFEKTRDVPLILSTAFSTNTKFRSSCEYFLTHCKLYTSWKDKTGSAKARCDSFKECLDTLINNGCNTNIILPPPIIIQRMDIQDNNRKCSGAYRYLIREIIEKLEDREGCRKNADERISECGNGQIIILIQEYHHYDLRFWTVTPEKPHRHRNRYRSSLMSYTDNNTNSRQYTSTNNDDDGDYQISTNNTSIAVNSPSTYNNNYIPITVNNTNNNGDNNGKYTFNDVYNDCNLPPHVLLDNIYDNTRSQYVDDRYNNTNIKPSPLRIMKSIGGNSSISDMSQSSTPTTNTTATASIPRGININGVNTNRSMKYSPIRRQSPYQSPRHNPLQGQNQGAFRGFANAIKSQRLRTRSQSQIQSINNQFQLQRPAFSRMSSNDSSLPDPDRLPGLPPNISIPIPDAGNLCTIKSGQEIDDEDDTDIQLIPGQHGQYPQIPTHTMYVDNYGYRPQSYQPGSIQGHGTRPNITRDLPAPPRIVMNNYEEMQSRNGVRHLSQELPMPKQQRMSHQRGMSSMGMINYNPPKFDMDFNYNQQNYVHHNNNNNNSNGNIIFNHNNMININFNSPNQTAQDMDMLNSSSTLHHSTVNLHHSNTDNNDHNISNELHQHSQSQMHANSQSQQFTLPTAKSTSTWFANWSSKKNNNTSIDFNNNNNDYNGNNQNDSGSNTEQIQFGVTNNNNNNANTFDHRSLNPINYDNCVIASNEPQFNQFDHDMVNVNNNNINNMNNFNQCTNNEEISMNSITPNVVYGGYNNDNYHNSNNDSNMINNNIINTNNDNNTFLFSGRNSQRMQLHNFGSYN